MASKVLTVVGARPQFIKAAVVSRVFAHDDAIEEVLIHTGQHYDYNMSQSFFDEMHIPEPKINLGISGGSHAEMTARMMMALEDVVSAEAPDVVLLYGDTNSTLAGALVAAKLHVPIVHVEAGARTRSMTNPEEINRICTDHISALLLACTEVGLSNLEAEGLAERSCFAGDPMLDAFESYRAEAKRPVLSSLIDKSTVRVPEAFYYLTCHREENTSEGSVLEGVLEAMNGLDLPVIYPVHPRNAATVRSIAADGSFENVAFVEPVSYLESVYLVSNARQVVTDSGGLQREAFFAGVKCTTVLGFEVWPETMVNGRNLLAEPNKESIIAAMERPQVVDPSYMPFGDGRSGMRIAKEIRKLVRSE